jgi:hypothetical protein
MSYKTRFQKRSEAETRQQEREKLTHTQQIARLDELLGKDIGAARERARLRVLIENEATRSPKKKRNKKRKKDFSR